MQEILKEYFKKIKEEAKNSHLADWKRLILEGKMEAISELKELYEKRKGK